MCLVLEKNFFSKSVLYVCMHRKILKNIKKYYFKKKKKKI